MTDEPPPLEQGSLTARLLHQVWSGDRLVRARSVDGPWRYEVAATIAAHLHLRAGCTVALVGHTRPDRVEMFKVLRRAMPTAELSVSGVVTAEVGEPVHVPGHGPVEVRPPFSSISPRQVDLVIVLDAKEIKRPELVACLLNARQMVVFGCGKLTDKLELDPVERTPPLDVSIAGGAW